MADTTKKASLASIGETSLARESFATGVATVQDLTQTFRQLTVRARPGEPGLEPLRLALERELRRGRRIPEGTVRKPEQHSSVLSEHRLVYKPEHTPQGHNMKDLLVHMLEHTSRPEQHSLV